MARKLVAGAGLEGGGDIQSAGREIRIAEQGVTTDMLADGAVTEPKIADNAVATNKIANDAVTNAKAANMTAWTIKMRNSASDGDPQDVAIGTLTEDADPTESGDFLLGMDANNELRKFSTRLVGGLHFLDGGTLGSVAQLDVSLTAFTAWRAFQVVLNLIPATDDVELWMRFSTNGGSSFDAGASDYRFSDWVTVDSGGSGVQGSTGATQIRLAGNTSASQAVSNTANEGGVNAVVEIIKPDVAQWTKADYKSSWITSGGNLQQILGAGARSTAQDTNALRFLFESGNIASGFWGLYGRV